MVRGDGANAPYFRWEYKITAGKLKGKTVSKLTSLNPEGLGILRDHMEAHGLEIPAKDPTIAEAHKLCKSAIGWTGTAEVLEREHGGRTYNDVVRLEDGEGGEEREGEELDTPDPDEVAEMSAKELKEVVDDHDLEIDLADYKSLKLKRKAVNDALDELREESEEEEGEEETEAEDWPTDEEIDEMSLADLKALNKEGELDVPNPPKGAKGVKLKKFRTAIKEAVAEQRGEEGEEGEELEPVARERIEKMSRKALGDLIEEYELDFDTESSAYKGKKGLVQLRDEVAEKLDEEGLLEE